MNQSRRLRDSCRSSLVSEDEEAGFSDAFALSGEFELTKLGVCVVLTRFDADIHYLPLFKRLKCCFVVLK